MRPAGLDILSVTVALLLMVPTLARGQEDGMAAARARFQEAIQLYDRGDYESALAEFNASYRLAEGHPRQYTLLYNLGLCQERLFRYDEALDSYGGYLQRGGAGDEHAGDARQALASLQQRIATLTIQSNVAAEVWVDNRHVGSAPGDVAVVGGRHVVELRAGGHAPSLQDIELAARTTQSITFHLDTTFGGLSPAFFITGAALTLVAAGIGAGFGGVALDQQSTIDARLANSDPRERYQVTQAGIDAMRQNALVADVMFGTAGVLAIASLVLVFFTDWGGSGAAESSSGPTLTPWATNQDVGLSLTGSF